MFNQAFLFAVLDERNNKLYEGNVLVLESIQYFKLKNIKYIIVIGQQQYTKFDGITYQKVDENINDLLSNFERTTQAIQNNLQRHSVLVCCSSGFNWSASFIIAYLIKTKRWQYEKAFYHLKAMKSLVNPSFALKKQLILFNTKVHNFNNQENDINLSNNLVIPSKFQQRIIEQKQKQQYFEDSVQSQDEMQSTGSQQGDKTPIFYSPKNNKKTNNTATASKTNSWNKEQKKNNYYQVTPNKNKVVRHVRNLTFQLEDEPMQEEIKSLCQFQNSPKFNEDKPIIRHRRRRIAYRNKSEISYQS